MVTDLIQIPAIPRLSGIFLILSGVALSLVSRYVRFGRRKGISNVVIQTTPNVPTTSNA
ncbi:hypothetical protein O9992_16410 [Vibrio lentus]|nr:hypothetical protein [Vibrio lentus]